MCSCKLGEGCWGKKTEDGLTINNMKMCQTLQKRLHGHNTIYFSTLTLKMDHKIKPPVERWFYHFLKSYVFRGASSYDKRTNVIGSINGVKIVRQSKIMAS